MNTIGTIALDLVVNGKDLKSQVKNQASVVSGAWAKPLAKLALAIASAFSVKAITDFTKKCLNLGSELLEVQNVVDTAFPSMNKQLDEFAKNAMTNFGMSETMAKRFTGTLGAMSQSFGFAEKQAYDMSTTLVQLAGDVASFYNLDPTESYNKMKSVFTGETEALKELGVVMTQTALDQFALANGFGKTTKEMTEQEKVSLRLAFVTKNLQMASGDFIKTQDSWANQTRVLSLRFDSLKASLGKGFIALFTPIIKGINNVLAWMQPLADSFANLMEMLTGTKQDVSKGILNDVGSNAGDLATNLENAGTSGEAAAKKIKRAFAGVDTINKLSFGSDSSSNSSGDSGGSSGNFAPSVNFPKMDAEATNLNNTMLSISGVLGDLGNAFSSVATEIGGFMKKVGSDVFGGMLSVFENNKDALSTAAMSILNPILNIGKTIKESIEDSWNTLKSTYDTKIGPSITKMADGVSSIWGSILGLWNESVAPVIESFGQKFSTVWKEHVQPFIDGIIEGWGNIAELFATIITDALAPFVQWCCDVLGPLLKPVFQAISDSVLNTIAVLGDIGTEVMGVFNGLVKSLTKLFKGDWKGAFETAWSAVTKPFKSMGTWFSDKFSGAWKNAKAGFSKVGTWAKEVVWSKVTSPFKTIGTWFGDKFSKAWKKAKEGFSKVGTWAKEKVWDKIASPFTSIKSWFSTKFSDAWTAAKAGFSKVATWASELWGKIKQPFADIATWFSTKFSAAWQAVKDVFSKGGEVFNGIKDGILNGLKAVVNGLISGINKVIKIPFDGINAALNKLKDVNILGLKPFDWVNPISVPQIPKLAQGGYVKANQPQLAMIGDNKRYGEIVAPENKMMEMINTALAMQRQQSSPDGLKEVIALLKRLIQVIAALSLSVDIDTKKLSVMLKQAEKDLAMLGG